jgi:hypothetical protein
MLSMNQANMAFLSMFAQWIIKRLTHSWLGLLNISGMSIGLVFHREKEGVVVLFCLISLNIHTFSK